MFDLPKSCLVNKFIPKKTFYEKIGITNTIKDEFIHLVEKITWLYKISPDTTGVNKTDKVEEIQIFEINVKEKKLPKGVIKTVTRSIQYPILFVIRYKEEFCYSIKVEENYYSDWNEEIDIIFRGISLEYIYEQIVKKIIKVENNEKKFDELIEDNTKKEILQKRIGLLKRKIRQEKQFNKKVELNNELKKAEKEMEELLNE